MNIALIPARGGSKRIHNKNIRNFLGTPILGRVIRKIENSGAFSQVVVSTDSEQVAEVARQFGASVQERQGELAGDHSGLLEVVQSQLINVVSLGHRGIVACVLPTAVLMNENDLSEAVRVVSQGESDFALSVGRFRYPIQRALQLNSQNHVSMIWPENYVKRSQDLDDAYHDAGQFYVGTTASWESRSTMFDIPARGVIVDDWRVQDIDVENDWQNAERLWQLFESD